MGPSHQCADSWISAIGPWNDFFGTRTQIIFGVTRLHYNFIYVDSTVLLTLNISQLKLEQHNHVCDNESRNGRSWSPAHYLMHPWIELAPALKIAQWECQSDCDPWGILHPSYPAAARLADLFLRNSFTWVCYIRFVASKNVGRLNWHRSLLCF
jgi:hypothetical protein